MDKSHRWLAPLLVLLLLVLPALASCTLGGGAGGASPTTGAGAPATAAILAPTTGTSPSAVSAGSRLASASPTPNASRPVVPGATVPPPGHGLGRVLTAPARTTRATPRGEQTLTIAGGSTAPSLDPALVRDAGSAFLTHQLFRGLVRLDDALEPVPDLAERIVIGDDGLTYTFTLREGAVFHDGRPITARAVKYSLERATDPALAGGRGGQLPGATYLNDIDGARDKLAGRARELRGVQAPDDRTVSITIDAPKVYFLMKLSHPVASVVDEANVRADPTGWARRPNGSGPFRLERLAADRLVMARFDRFYAGAPTLATVDILLGPAANEPMNLYEGDKIDYTRVPLSSVDRVLVASSALRAELTITPSLSLTYIGFNVNEPPFDDPAVRRAFVQALDRDKIARISQGGKVVKAEGIVPPTMPGGDWGGGVPAYDLPAARASLAGSRYGGAAGLPRVSIYGASGSLPVTMQKVYERDLGVPVEVIGVDWPEYLEGLGERDYPAFELSWIADYPDPENFLAVLFATGSGENHTGYSSPMVDRLLGEAAVERDPERRRALYREAQARIIDDAVIIPCYHSIDYTLVKPHVKGLAITAMGILELDGVWIER